MVGDEPYRLIVFARAPEKGKVKSRLAAELGEERALDLYLSFADAVFNAAEAAGFPIVVGFHPQNRRALMEKWLGKTHAYLAQQKGDLGRKMAAAFEQVFNKGARGAILIGADIPGLSPAHLENAFRSLTDHDAVIGPSSDGGYWLIGFNREQFAPGCFSKIRWGTPAVYRETLNRFSRSGLRFAVMPELDDMDTAADVRAFMAADPGSVFRPPEEIADPPEPADRPGRPDKFNNIDPGRGAEPPPGRE